MKKTILTLAILSTLSGCAVIQSTGVSEQKPEVAPVMMQKEFNTIAAPATGKRVSVAVYGFKDLTGQRKPSGNIAQLSTAVTQGGETFLIKALQDVGRGEWFEVVERVGLDNLTKERLIIRQMREAYEGKDAKPLMPMQFAGIIIEGGIVGYDSSTKSGGAGYRWLGIGPSTLYSEDVVTVSLRAISVNTGKVLTTVTVQKTILSSADSIAMFKFFDAGTKAFEAEAGLTINEPGTYAVKSAIEAAVVELIKDGEKKGLWDFKKEVKNELVQKNTTQDRTPEAETKATEVKPNSGKDVEGNKAAAQPEKPAEVKLPDSNPAAQRTMKSIGRSNVRATDQSGATILEVLSPGESVVILDETKDLFLVQTRVGRKGWVLKEALK